MYPVLAHIPPSITEKLYARITLTDEREDLQSHHDEHNQPILIFFFFF